MLSSCSQSSEYSPDLSLLKLQSQFSSAIVLLPSYYKIAASNINPLIQFMEIGYSEPKDNLLCLGNIVREPQCHTLPLLNALDKYQSRRFLASTLKLRELSIEKTNRENPKMNIEQLKKSLKKYEECDDEIYMPKKSLLVKQNTKTQPNSLPSCDFVYLNHEESNIRSLIRQKMQTKAKDAVKTVRRKKDVQSVIESRKERKKLQILTDLMQSSRKGVLRFDENCRHGWRAFQGKRKRKPLLGCGDNYYRLQTLLR